MKKEEEGEDVVYQNINIGTGQVNTIIRIGEHIRDDDVYMGQVDVKSAYITLESTREGDGVRVAYGDGAAVYVDSGGIYMDSDVVICGDDLHVYGNIYVYGSIVQM